MGEAIMGYLNCNKDKRNSDVQRIFIANESSYRLFVVTIPDLPHAKCYHPRDHKLEASYSLHFSNQEDRHEQRYTQDDVHLNDAGFCVIAEGPVSPLENSTKWCSYR